MNMIRLCCICFGEAALPGEPKGARCAQRQGRESPRARRNQGVMLLFGDTDEDDYCDDQY
jgi:hypothetical protein